VDSIRESLERISELTTEELQALQEAIANEFGTLSSSVEGNPTREAVDAMTELADANDFIIEEQGRRTQEAEELSAAAEAAISRFNTGGEEAVSEEPATAEGEPVAEEEVVEEEVPEAEAAAAEDPEEEEEGTPEEESKETPEEEDEEKKKKDLENFSADSETVSEAPAESEAAIEETPEAEAPAEEPAEAEFSAEETPEAEVPAEETITEEVEADSTEDSTPESTEETTVTASNTPNELAFEAPEDLKPTIKAASASYSILAGSDLAGITAGTEFADLSAVAQAMLTRKHGMGRTTGGDGEQALVASIRTTFPDSRMLNSNDVEGNRAKINAVVAPEAIVAAGGLTAPVETSWDIFELGETDVRPVKNALAVFGADRGGLRFLTPPLLSDLDGAVSLWTIQDDIDAASEDGPNPVKPCIRVAAGVEVTVYTDAIPLCLTFGNLGARAYPELVERHTKLGMVEHARYAETRLLTRIGALSTPVTAAAELGAARDIFVQLEQAAAAYRSRYRLDPKTPLRVLFPEWFKNALRADLTKQIPGDGRDGTFNLAEAEINRWFAVRNINVSWFIDGETGQVFGAQAPGALLKFPSTVIWYLFSEGTFVFLDGGTLDLGLVRDSTLNGTNDYKIFLETFEGVAKVGVESLRVTSNLAIKGSASSTTVVAG
jgi:hypothetical protein